ncbi:peptidase M3 [Parabacteroides sp. An277]|uniref:M3 family metallopeptidase n=1 Tax=Parabacteroides sp. An277 TaxID=1965619 RepID=UPI000B3779C0|nr:M3 family metallopeptidase [Parabacteroides sp. An277]OUO50994.1 peptidase M3 [Parabacteroides sp. An277]
MGINRNPLLESWNTPFNTPPFDRIQTADYEPAFEVAIREQQEAIARIVQNPAAPDFANTIVAIERSGELLERICGVFFNVLNAAADDELMAVSERISPKLTACTNDVYLNNELFERVQAVYAMRDQLELDVEDRKLLDETYRAFQERGATLSAADKDTYRALSEELSLLSLRFEQNALRDKQRFELWLDSDDQLAGLPASIREAAAHRAKEKGRTGWLFTLDAPSYVPFMRYADSRPLRERMYRAYLQIGCKGDEFDNQEIVRRIVNVRLQLANLLGFPDYAAFALSRKMAKDEAHVYRLLNDLLAAYKPVAMDELRAVQDFAVEQTHAPIELMPWDWSYFSEQLKDSRFQINDEMTRPYFSLENVQRGVFGLATRLYGITFQVNSRIPVYHPEVQAYEVYDADGTFLAILYTDFFPRQGKQSGAWMNSVKPQYRDAKGLDSRPQVIVVMNFTRPTDTKPSLLTYDEVETFLHEFGHALHGIFAAGRYASLSGTNVYQDFVELPSQLMENWLRQPEFLDGLAVHYETGERIPADWVQKLVDVSNFNVGYACCRQVSFGLLDMAWHTLKEPFEGNVPAFEKAAWKPAVLLPDVSDTCMSTNFSHLFANGYAAGYYGYKWAEVLDADAFSLFLERGIFSREVARSFRELILSKGGTEDPAELYRRFRGKDPSIDALLKRNGLR